MREFDALITHSIGGGLTRKRLIVFKKIKELMTLMFEPLCPQSRAKR